MANIDELHFEVILKDDDFRKRVAKDIELANKLNVNLSDALNFNKKVRIEPLNRVKQAFQDIEKSEKRANKERKNHNKALNDSAKLMRTLSKLTGVTFSVVGVRRFLSTLIDITGQFEVQKMALRNMLQDLDGADKIFHDLYVFSSNSTYRFSELAKHAKQLAAFNIDQESLLETTKMLGDVASGVGVSMDRIILAYGHVKSSGFLRGIQLRSFSQNGVPVLEELSKMLTEVEGKTVSLGDVFDKMMKREITFEMVEEAFKRMTSEGGKFYQMQEVLAKTLAGQINILKGKWENLMYAIGESQEGILKGVVQVLTRIVSNTENFGKAMLEGVIVLGAYRTAMIITTAATEGLAAATSHGLLSALKKMAAFIVANPYAILAAGVALAVIEFVKLKNEMGAVEKLQKKLADGVSDYRAAQASEISELDRLYARLKLAKEGTEEYNSAKMAIESRFGPYISQLRAEGVEVGNLANVYDDLARKIDNANKSRFLESTLKGLEETNESGINEILGEHGRLVGALGDLSLLEEEALWQYIQGKLPWNDIVTTMPELAKKLSREMMKAVTSGTSVTGGTMTSYAPSGETYEEWLDELALKYGNLQATYRRTREEAENAFKILSEGMEYGPDKPQMLIKINSIVEGIKNIDTQIEAIRTKAKKGGITEAEEEQLKTLMESREDAVKQYKNIMGVDYDKSVKASETAQDKATKERIRSLKAEISILEKYRDAREKLEPYFGDDTNRQLAALFGERDYDAVDEDIQKLIRDLYALGAEGAQAAEQIETRLGMDALGMVLKRQKAIEKYNKTLADWMGKDYSSSGTSVEYKASRIAAKYNEDVYATQKKFNEAVKQATEAHKGDAEAIAEEIEKLKQLRDEEIAYHATQRDESIASLANDIYKQATKGIDLTNWAHKSVGELRNIQKQLRNIQLPEYVKQLLDGNQPALDKLVEAFKALAEGDLSKLGEILPDKTMRNFQMYAQMVSSLGDSLTRIGEASGNGTMKQIGEGLSFIADSASSVFERLAKGDMLGAFLSVITSIITGLVDTIAEAAEFQRKLREIREEARRDNLADMLGDGVDSVFGTNSMAKVNNVVAVMKKAREAMNARGGDRKFRLDNTGFLGTTEWAPRTLESMAKSIGRSLYDAYGNFNAETLQAILDTYNNLKQSEKEWIQAAINDSEAYAEAMEQLKGVVESVFGQIASSSSDKIVESWKERSNAALDYADILDDVATRYAKMMIESTMLDTILDEEKAKSIVDMFAHGNAAGAMEQIAEDMAAIQGMAPVWEQILETFEPYFNRSNTGGDTLKDGINKELVEGNSSLIASYINAMRADLSVMRQMQSDGWQDMRFIRESVPSLVDYAAQVAANTYNNAQNTQAILAKLQSIITPSTNGGSAVRTTK